MADAAGNAYGPYDIEVAGSQAEAFTESAWFEFFGDVSGVKSGGDLTFTGLTATLSAINARVHGSYLIRTSPWSDASPATTTPSPRRDMMVARRQTTAGSGGSAVAGKSFLTVLRGTPAATPAEPTDFNPVTDEPLWSWQVPGNGGTVVTGVKDLRRAYTPFGTPLRPEPLTPSTGWVAESGAPGSYDAPSARLMPWGEVRLAGIIRRSAIAPQTAGANVLIPFTDSIPSQFRPRDGQARFLNAAQSPSGPAGIYLRPEANATTGAAAYALAYSFLQDTTVYQISGWAISLNGLSYFL